MKLTLCGSGFGCFVVLFSDFGCFVVLFSDFGCFVVLLQIFVVLWFCLQIFVVMFLAVSKGPPFWGARCCVVVAVCYLSWVIAFFCLKDGFAIGFLDFFWGS